MFARFPKRHSRPARVLIAALALCVLAGAWAGTARAQGGVWTTVPVPGTSVLGVADGDSGRVVIAGANGAFRFDGFRMRRLPIFSTTTDSLVGKAVLHARNGDTWYAHLQGVIRLAADGTVSRYDATSGVGNFTDSEVTCLAESPDGVIWAGTRQGGLSKFDGTGWSTVTTDQGLPSMSVAGLGVDPNDGSMWVGCMGSTGGLAHVVGAAITVYNGFTLPAFPEVRCVAPTVSGRVWFGTDAGIGRLDNGQVAEFATGTAVTSIAEGGNGELWIGTGTRGVGRFDNGAVLFLPSGPPSASILSLYADPAGALWVSTTAGLARYEGAPWLPVTRTATGMPAGFSGLSALRVRTADAPGDSVDGDGATWIGMQNLLASGIDTWNLAQRVNGAYRLFGSADGLPVGNVVALAPADSGQVWMGSYSNPSSGIARVSLAGNVLQRVDAQLPSIDVLALRRAGAGSVWAGTARGVALVDGAGVRALPVGPAAVPDATIRGLDLDDQGRLWIATGAPLPPDTRPGAGAVRFDPRDSSYVRLDTGSGLPTNTLNSVSVFANGDVWFGTPLGAARWSGGGVTTFTTAQGLPGNIVTRVVEGLNGEAWIATNGGLVQYDGANMTVYNVGDGMPGASLANAFADSLGVVAALRTDGAALFHPDRTPPNAEIVTAPPAVTGSRDAQFGVRGGDLDSGTRGILLSYQLDGGVRTPFAEDVTAAAFSLLPDGVHTFRLWAKDRALNAMAAPEQWTFEVDATAPRPIVQAPAFDAIVRDTVDVLGSVDDPRFASYTIDIRPKGAADWDTLLVATALPAPGAPLYRWDTKQQLDGVWELRVGSTDNLGLNGYVSVNVTIDNLAPGASVTSPAKVDHVAGGRVYTTNGEVELDVPPNAWPADQIVTIDPLRQPQALPIGWPANAIWGPSWTIAAGDSTLDKRATLILRLGTVPPTIPAAIYRVIPGASDTSVVLLGGERSADGASISTSISDLGGVVVAYGGTATAGAGYSGARGLDCQPRVLSPNGGGFDVRTAISFDLGKAGTGAIKVFDRAGRLVREVVESGSFVPGRNVVFWDGKDGEGRVVPSGLYVVAVRFDGETSVASVAVANR